jgi:hypothetical protein
VSGKNLVIANIYGRTAAGAMRPLLVGADGKLNVAAGASAPETVTDWTEVDGPVVLTPLFAFADFADAAQILIGVRVAADSVDSARFIVESSEDGSIVSKSSRVEIELAAGEADAWLSETPLLRQHFRLSVEPQAAGPVKVSYRVRKIAR